jgi:hypothetical protein
MPFDLKSAVPVVDQEGTPASPPKFDINTALQMTSPVDDEEGFEAFQRSKWHQSIKDSIDGPLTTNETQFILDSEQKDLGAVRSFAIPYTEGVVGFFTRPFGFRPDVSRPFGLKKGPTTQPEIEKQAAMQKGHPVSFTMGQIVAGTAPFLMAAPLFPQTLLGMVGTFATARLTTEFGRQRTEESLLLATGEKAKLYGIEGIKAGVMAPIWYFSGGLSFIGRPFTSAMVRAGARGTGVAGLELAFGTDLSEALKQGGIITALSLMFEVPSLASTALGRGMLNRGNTIIQTKHPGIKLEWMIPRRYAWDPIRKTKVPIPPIHTWDQATARVNIFKMVKTLHGLMKGKLDNVIKPIDPAKQITYNRLPPPTEPPPEAPGAVWAPKTPLQPQAGGMAFRPQQAPVFYSKMMGTLAEKMPESAPVDQIKGILKSSGIAEEEITFSGIDDFLKGKTKVDKVELLEYLKANQIVIEEVWKGEKQKKQDMELLSQDMYGKPISKLTEREKIDLETEWGIQGTQMEAEGRTAPKFAAYQLPGGTNYQEVVLTAPIEGVTPDEIAQDIYNKPYSALTSAEKTKIDLESQRFKREGPYYKSPHWDEPNVLAHIRLTDRTTPDGKKVLFIEEIQSDWARAKKEMGEREVTPGEEVETGMKMGEKVPSHPALKNWKELALKRMLRYAVEQGYDAISWTTGQQQADRYDLSKVVSLVAYKKNPDGTIGLNILDKDNRPVFEPQRDNYRPEELPRIIGKDLADKIIKAKKELGSFKGKDLKVGGEWAKSLYDVQIPSILKSLTKKMGGEIGAIKFVAPIAEKGGQYTILKTSRGYEVNDNSAPMGAETIKIFKYKKDAQTLLDSLLGMTQQSLQITLQMKQVLLAEGQPILGKVPRDVGIPGKEFVGIKIFRMDEEAKIVNTKGEIVTLPKGEEYRTVPVYDSEGNIVSNKVRLIDGKQLTVYTGELNRLKGKMLGEGDQPKAGGVTVRPKGKYKYADLTAKDFRTNKGAIGDKEFLVKETVKEIEAKVSPNLIKGLTKAKKDIYEKTGLHLTITSTGRTPELQKRLTELGRKTEKESKHLTGAASDIVFRDKDGQNLDWNTMDFADKDKIKEILTENKLKHKEYAEEPHLHITPVTAGIKPPKKPPVTAVAGGPEEGLPPKKRIDQRKEEMTQWNVPWITEQLLPSEKEFVKKYIDEGKTFKEIAKDLGESVEDVKKTEMWTYAHIQEAIEDAREEAEKVGIEDYQERRGELQNYLQGKLKPELREKGEYADLKLLPWLWAEPGKGVTPDELVGELSGMGYPVESDNDVRGLIGQYFDKEIQGRAEVSVAKEDRLRAREAKKGLRVAKGKREKPAKPERAITGVGNGSVISSKEDLDYAERTKIFKGMPFSLLGNKAEVLARLTTKFKGVIKQGIKKVYDLFGGAKGYRSGQRTK